MAEARLPRRPNYRGEMVPAGAGIFFVLPALALLGVAAAYFPGLRREALLHAAAVGAFAGLGLLDDVYGSRAFGGIRGHLTALLRHRQVTTGLVKLAGGAAAGLALGWQIHPRWGEALMDGAVIALAANMVNLLDLRPGRALKGFALGALLLAPWGGLLPVLAIALPAACYAPADLRARAMMGDTGANALGAALGTAAALRLPPGARLVLLALLAGLHVASEKVSFTRVIDGHPVLRFLDRLGREPQD